MKQKNKTLGAIESKILEEIQKGNDNNASLSKLLNKSRSTVSYHISQLKQKGLINEIDNGIIKNYELTSVCSKFIKECDDKRRLGELWHIHFISLKFDILKDVRTLPKDWENYKTKDKFNWDSYKKRIESKLGYITIERTPKSFIISLPKLITKTLGEATRLENQLAFEILDFLKSEFKGIKLGALDSNNRIQEIAHSITTHNGLPNDILAQLCYDNKLTLRSDRILIDNSPKNIELLKKLDPTIKGELETIDKSLGKDDIITIFDEYHNIINGSLSANRLNSLESRQISGRKDIEEIQRELTDSTWILGSLTSNLKEISISTNKLAENVNAQMNSVGSIISGNMAMQQNNNNVLLGILETLSQMQVQINQINLNFKNEQVKKLKNIQKAQISLKDWLNKNI